MKKAISILLIAILLASLIACGTAKEPVVISPGDFDALNEKHMSSLLVGMIIARTWQDANEVEPERFMYYYASVRLQSDKDISKTWVDGFIPADELEPMVQSHFDVTTEHLRSNMYYNAEINAYEFGGLGSTTDCKITNAVRNGKQITIDYDLIGPMDYKGACGKLLMEQAGEDYGNEDFKYLSNQFERSAQSHLDFPSAKGESDKYGVFMMVSGGRTSISSDDGVTWKHYDGQDLVGIISFYENEALPALEAQGSADTSRYEDGWYWSGTYRGGTPLTIDVQRKFGADTYIITALYDTKSNPDIANNIRNRNFMQPPDLNYFPELYRAYLWKPCSAGILNDYWNDAENARVPSLVALYALSLTDDEKNAGTQTTFPAEDVESYVQQYFDISIDMMRGWNVYDRDKNVYTYTPADSSAVCNIVSATSYGSEDKNPIKIVLAYDVMPSDEDDTVLWSGELTIELSGSGFKYMSNNKYYPLYPITQDEAYLDEITQKYISWLAPYTGILSYSWPTPQDIKVDNLVDFCSANNLLNLNRENDEYVEHHGTAAQVETAIKRYFDVSAEYLRTSSRYHENYADTVSGEQYVSEYEIGDGGGWNGAVALNAEQNGDILKITVGIYGPDDEPYRPVKIGLLTIKLNGANYQYLSYKLENEIANG